MALHPCRQANPSRPAPSTRSAEHAGSRTSVPHQPPGVGPFHPHLLVLDVWCVCGSEVDLTPLDEESSAPTLVSNGWQNKSYMKILKAIDPPCPFFLEWISPHSGRERRSIVDWRKFKIFQRHVCFSGYLLFIIRFVMLLEQHAKFSSTTVVSAGKPVDVITGFEPGSLITCDTSGVALWVCQTLLLF
jgi:hypothetical protein